MATLAEIRARHPEYSDLDDKTLADGLYRKFYSDLPRSEFDRRIAGAPEPTVANAVADVGGQLVRGVNRGVNAVLSLPGELVGGAVNLVAPGQGDRFRFDNQFSRFMSSPDAKPETAAGRYADAAGQAIGSSVIPMAGMSARAAQAAGPAARTTLGAIGQQAVQSYRAAPGVAVRGDLAAAAGAGVGQQAAEDMGFGAGGQMVGGVVGGMVPALAGTAARAVSQPVRQALANQGEAGAYAAIARQLPDGVDQFADDVSVGATTRTTAVQRRTLDVLGEEMERAGGNVARAEQAAIARIAQEFGVTPQTAQANIRNLSAVHRDSRLMLGEYPAVARSDVDNRRIANPDLDDVNRVQTAGTQESLDYLANAGTAPSATAVRNAVSRRQEDMAPAMRETLESIGPQVQGRPAVIEDAADMIDGAQQAGRAAYQTAYRSPINNWELVTRLPRVLQSAYGYANTRSGDTAAALRRAADQFFIQHQGQPLAMGTLQQLQDARSAVRDQITALRNSGQNSAAATVQRFYDQITQVMGRASPAWRQANDQWADMNFLRIGADLGDAFATRAGPQFRQQLREFERLAPQAQDIVRIHFLQKLYDKLDNLGDTHSVSKLFSTDHARNMIRQLFGGEAAVAFTRAVRDQRAAEVTQRMMGGSQTAQRLARREQMETEGGLVAAAQQLNAGDVRNWLMTRLRQLVTERRNQPMADILTTPMSDTARVARHINNLRAAQARQDRLNRPGPLRVPIGGRLVPALNPLMDDSGTR